MHSEPVSACREGAENSRVLAACRIALRDIAIVLQCEPEFLRRCLPVVGSPLVFGGCRTSDRCARSTSRALA